MSIADLHAALARAATAFRPVTRDRANPHLHSQYATLTSAIDATRPALAAEGLAVLQAVEPVADGYAVRTRILGHGAELDAGLCPVVVGDHKGLSGAQAWGSALTYARRYGYSAALCLAPSDDDDDDGHAAGPPPARAPKAAQAAPSTPPAARSTGRHPPMSSATLAARLADAVPGAGLADLAAWRAESGKDALPHVAEWGSGTPPEGAWHLGGVWAALVAGQGEAFTAWFAAGQSR